MSAPVKHNTRKNVTLSRTPGGRLGFKIRTVLAKHAGSTENETVTLAYGMQSPLPSGGGTDANRQLCNNDRILSVNSQSVTHLSQSDVARLLKDDRENEVCLSVHSQFGNMFYYGHENHETPAHGTRKVGDRRDDTKVSHDAVEKYDVREKLNVNSPRTKSPRHHRHHGDGNKTSNMTNHAASHTSPMHEFIRMKDIAQYGNRNNENRRVTCDNRHPAACDNSPPATRDDSRRKKRNSDTKKSQSHNYASADDVCGVNRRKVDDPISSTSTWKGFVKSLFRSRSYNALSNKKSTASSHAPSPRKRDSESVSPRNRRWKSEEFAEETIVKTVLSPAVVDRRESSIVMPANQIIAEIFDQRRIAEYHNGPCRKSEIGEKCRCLHCSRMIFEWQQEVLKQPHVILWKPETRVVCLERSKRESLGFTFKVKIGKNRDGSQEVYTLVEHVKRGSIAEGHLCTGDWIRSINGKPLCSMKEALSLNRYMEKTGTVRLIIQRPEFFPPDRRRIPKHTKKSSPPLSCHIPVTKSDISLPEKSKSLATIDGHSMEFELKPVHHSVEVNLSNGVTNRRTNRSPVTNSHSLAVSRREPSSVPIASPHVPSSSVQPPSPGVHITYIQKHPNALDEPIACPRRRIFIVGSQAMLLTQILFPRAKDSVFAAWIDQRCKFYYFKSCVLLDENYSSSQSAAGANIVDRENYRDAASPSALLSRWFCEHTEISADDVFVNMEQSVISEARVKFTPWIRTITLDLDVFTVFDMNFFVTCCHPFFTHNSLVYVALDARKCLDDASVELSAVSNIVHAIRSFPSCLFDFRIPIQLYAVLESHLADNVVTLEEELRVRHCEIEQTTFQHLGVTIPVFVATPSNSVNSPAETRDLQDALLACILPPPSSSSKETNRFRVASLLVWAQLEKMTTRHQLVVTVGNLAHCVRENVIDLSDAELHSVIHELNDCGLLIIARNRHRMSADSSLESTDFLLTDPSFVLDCIQSFVVNLQKTSPIGQLLSSSVQSSPAVTGSDIHLALAIDDKDANVWMTVLKNLSVILQLYQRDDAFIIPYFSPLSMPSASLPSSENSDVIELVFEESVAFTLFLELVVTLGWTYHHADVAVESLTRCRVTNADLVIVLELIDLVCCTIRVTTLPKGNGELPRSFQKYLNEAYRDVFHSSRYRVAKTLVNGISIVSAPSDCDSPIATVPKVPSNKHPHLNEHYESRISKLEKKNFSAMNIQRPTTSLI